MQHQKLNYIEFPSRDLEKTKCFFTEVFAWSFIDYGPEYSSFTVKDAGMDGGFYKADLASNTANGSTLAVFYSNDLESTMARAKAAGAEIIKDIFTFPGGRRFHFTEPSGNEFAVWSDKGQE